MTGLAEQYRGWVKRIMGEGFEPHPWQLQLALEPNCTDRLIRIPTGFGKTLGILLAWGFHRLERGDESWPRRLVWCLPMRVLAEQTEAEVRTVLGRMGVLAGGGPHQAGQVAVHLLIGGAGSSDYHQWPEECGVILGTQDMLLSRALNRGYGAARARWPMEFGLLNHDALWVLDEVQLMDVGLATSAQLQAYRRSDEGKCVGGQQHCRSWWMSATMQPGWLKSVDTENMLKALPPAVEIPEKMQVGGLWAVKKAIEFCPVTSDKDLGRDVAGVVQERHVAGTLTLVVVNRVEHAVAVFTQLQKLSVTAELQLVHSRFRPHERARWREEFLCKDSIVPRAGRIVVATQVIEAGVDISARTLVTDLAPWSSLVQRFGRCARYPGESGSVILLDRLWVADKDEARAMPYDVAELLESKRQLDLLTDVSPRALEQFDRDLDTDVRKRLYPYHPKSLLLRREWNDLFDTTPDLTGADLDISRFIRSGEELDLQVFWRRLLGTGPIESDKPRREELCAVPFRKAQEWLCGKQTKEKPAPRLKPKMSAWVWDWLDGAWKELRRADLLPGRIVIVDVECGGYSSQLGWDPESQGVEPVPFVTGAILPEDDADDSQDNETLSLTDWKTIGTHGQDAAEVLRGIVKRLGLPQGLTELLELTAEVHDLGKGAPFFQGSIQHPNRPRRNDLAKAPGDAWPRESLYCAGNGERRRGYRHELASALALFDILRQCAPEHPALLGDYSELLGIDITSLSKSPVLGDWERRIVALPSRDAFDLVVYLVAAHHGKVRIALHASPIDQEYEPPANDEFGPPIRGVREGDSLPELNGEKGLLAARRTITLEPAQLGLSNATGPSWSERTLALLEQYGPAQLAWFELLIRAADIRASKLKSIDRVLQKESAQ